MKDSPRKIAIDTSAFIALLSVKDLGYKKCRQFLKQLPETTEPFTTESCLVETSYILPAIGELRNQLKNLIGLLKVSIVPLNFDGLQRVFELQDRYASLPMDFADATLLVACERLNINDVFTLDRKDFSIYRPSHCARLKIHPE